ncbi:MAG: SDR family oxidoreductase [Actinomycetota bacterium]|nr:SDR family oxidoreductase [Actinomycetota bacterium]
METAAGPQALLDLAGRRALVTGGAAGIGAAVSSRLVEAGAEVTVADHEPHGANVVESLGAKFVLCDITIPTELTAAVDAAAGDQALHVLVNNAGIFPTTGPLIDVEDEFVARMLDVNIRAQFSATREAVRRMSEGGSIVNLASIAALRGGAGISAYSASKAGIVALTRAAAHEFGPVGIRVNAVAPGIIDTPGVQDQLGPLRDAGVDVAELIAANPQGVAGHPDHVARAVLFLVSDLAVFVNGHVLVVDGGATA